MGTSGVKKGSLGDKWDKIYRAVGKLTHAK